MPSSATSLALLYEPDGYTVAGRNVMGRHAAGESFLKAAAQAQSGGELWAYTSSRKSADVFASQVRGFNNSVSPRWCPKHRLDLLQQVGTLFCPGPDIATTAKLRLRQGHDAFSLCGITHTTASHRAMNSLSSTLQSPLEPWDAIICTSKAVADTVRLERESEEEYLRWRFGKGIAIPDGPQFPVIPLGIHTGDFAFSEKDRQTARSSLGLESDEVAILFVGRLSFHAKAHPDAMYLALETLAAQGRKIVLLQCGWFENSAIEAAFKNSLAESAPSVRALFVDGRDARLRAQSWAAADIFISLADNIQETFGLTPVEAMAAGLPALVTDWNGYKDTVRDGEDGFRVSTYLAPPQSGAGRSLAQRYEAGAINYDHYCAYASSLSSIDMGELVEKLGALVDSPALRQTMGEKGRKRAAENYDWRVIYGQYEALWSELGAIRRAARHIRGWMNRVQEAPAQAPGVSDPLVSFEHYSTHTILPSTRVSRSERQDGLDFAALLQHPFYGFATPLLPKAELVSAIRLAAETAVTVQDLTQTLGRSAMDLAAPIAILAKMGLLKLNP